MCKLPVCVCVHVLALAVTGCGGWFDAASQPTLQTPVEIEITARNFEWHVRYPGPDGRLHTRDDVFGMRDLYVPSGLPTRLHLRSRDYVYTLHLPRQQEREIAVPGMKFDIFFAEEDEGDYPLRGDQMCGYTHKSLIGRLYVEPEARFHEAVGRMVSQ